MKLPRSRASIRLDRATGDVWAVHNEALKRIEAGEDVIALSVGDPDFPTPAFITEKVVESLETHRTHYSPPAGEPALRDAIAQLESLLTHRNFARGDIAIFPGATGALFCTLSCIADPGDHVVVAQPMYIGYGGLFDAVGVVPQAVALREPDFSLDLADVEAAITPQTRALLINTPGNPCGNLIAPTVLMELAAMARRYGIWLICDEVYSLIYFDQPHVSMLRCAENFDNIVVVDGLSKSHAMSGWRVGWVVAPNLVHDLVEFSGSAFFGCSQFVQDAAVYALQRDAPQVAAMRDEYRRRRDYVARRIAEIDGLRCAPPKAGMFVMMDVGQEGEAFARRLLDEGGVSTIPGSGFGTSTLNYVRVGLTQELPILEEAFDRIERVV